MHWVQSLVATLATGGGGASNRTTLLRDTKGTGTPDVRTVFIDHLYSPFGVALVGNDLYVADTDKILRFRYTEGQTAGHARRWMFQNRGRPFSIPVRSAR